MSAVDEHAEAHRLKSEGHGARRIAAELGITRYAADRLLKRPLADGARQSATGVADGARRPGGGRQARRAEVGRLRGEGLSVRAIADRLKVSKDTVRRDLGDLTQVAEPVVQPVGRAAAARVLSAPVRADQHLVITLTPGLADDLATLRRTGCSAQDAVDYAVQVLADAYRSAVDSGVLADGDPLNITTVHLRPPLRPAARASHDAPA